MPQLEAGLRASVQAAMGTWDAAAAAGSSTPTTAAAAATAAPTSPGNVWAPSCCNEAQTTTLVLVFVYAVVIAVLWSRTPLLLPLKMVVIMLHEFSHATATWLTCGTVDGIEVHSNQGGVTKTRGGNQFLILSAGYLGSSFWGMVFILSTSNLYAVQAAAGALAVMLLVSMAFAHNVSLALLNVLFLALIAGFWACTLLTPFNGLRYFVLLVGTMSSGYSIWDIFDDLLARKVEESDAVQLAKLTGTSSRCWGAIWALVAVLFFALAIYLTLVVEALGSNVG